MPYAFAMQMTFTGVFATHQHDLLLPELRLFPSPASLSSTLQRTVWWRMCSRTVSPAQAQAPAASALSAQAQAYIDAVGCAAVVPTYKVSEGADTTSLAFQVAIEQARLWLSAATDGKHSGMSLPRCSC